MGAFGELILDVALRHVPTSAVLLEFLLVAFGLNDEIFGYASNSLKKDDVVFLIMRMGSTNSGRVHSTRNVDYGPAGLVGNYLDQQKS